MISETLPPTAEVKANFPQKPKLTVTRMENEIGTPNVLQFGNPRPKRSLASTSQGFHPKLSHKSLSQAYRLMSLRNKNQSLQNSIVLGHSANFNRKWDFPFSLDHLQPLMALKNNYSPEPASKRLFGSTKAIHDLTNGDSLYFSEHLNQFVQQHLQKKIEESSLDQQSRMKERSLEDSMREEDEEESEERIEELQDDEIQRMQERRKKQNEVNLESIFEKFEGKKEPVYQEKRPRVSAKIGDQKAGKKFELFFQEVEITPWKKNS